MKYADEPVWIVEAKKYLGLHEGTNEEPNPAVLRFFALCNHPEVTNDHKTAWCAAFVCGILRLCKIPVPAECETLWATDLAKLPDELQRPIYGCIGVKHRGQVPIGASVTTHPLGHVCFIIGETPANYLCLGGNQGDRVCIEAIEKSGFFAFRWPPREPTPLRPHPMLVSIPELRSGLSEQ